MKTWPGHAPITSTALLSLLNRASTGHSDFTATERILFTLSEFWAAASTGTLLDHLNTHVGRGLADARTAFSVIGAAEIVSLLDRAIAGYEQAPTEQLRKHCLMDLQQRVIIVDDSIDLKIENLAKTVVRAG
jgi:hypothetical protein